MVLVQHTRWEQLSRTGWGCLVTVIPYYRLCPGPGAVGNSAPKPDVQRRMLPSPGQLVLLPGTISCRSHRAEGPARFGQSSQYSHAMAKCRGSNEIQFLLVPEEYISTSTSNKVLGKHGFFPLCHHPACEGHRHPPLSTICPVASLSEVWLAISGSTQLVWQMVPVVTAAPKTLA